MNKSVPAINLPHETPLQIWSLDVISNIEKRLTDVEVVPGTFLMETKSGAHSVKFSEIDDLPFQAISGTCPLSGRVTVYRSKAHHRAYMQEHDRRAPTRTEAQVEADRIRAENYQRKLNQVGTDEWKILERMKEDDRTGALYATNVEIAFPPQVKDDTGRDGLIVDIREILYDRADLADREGETASAAALRYIADKYYPEDDEEFDGLDELDDEDDQDGAG
jgi:hypothetical protein